MEMTFDTSYFGWILAVSFGLYMVYRHIMNRMHELQRSLHDDMRGNMEYGKEEMEFIRNRIDGIERRISTLEVAPKPQSKDKAPYNSTAYYNTEA
jgi:transcription elongation GreA/GreB family factor